MIKLKYIFIFLALLSPIYTLCQTGTEVLVDIESKRISTKSFKSILPKSSFELPFFDDFSKAQNTPSQNHWLGSTVYINTKYAINPKTIGVATFDALNSKGNLHTQVSTSPFSSDTLLSRAINLFYPNDTTIYISFYFQPQGLGYQPGLRDSLVLEFFDSQLEQWVGVWASRVDFSNKKLYQYDKIKQKEFVYNSDTLGRTFVRAHLPIRNQRFLTSNFQFRFRNFASLSTNIDVPGLRGNSDHWHIDLVYLNRDRSYKDTLLNDITFSHPLSSILINYEAIPWTHFNALAKEKELLFPLPFEIKYRNLGAQTPPWNVTRRFSVKNNSSNNIYSFSGGSENVFALQDVSFQRMYEYDFQSSWADSASYTFTSFLETDINPETQHLRWNDTIRYIQRFKDYYALDDGSAESGYGIYGEGTQNGRVAVKFTTYKADWLTGIYIYFNRTYLDANQKYFKLAVWDDNKGKPGNIIYEQSGAKPEQNDLNKFSFYKFDEKVWIEPGVFYVGWIQVTNDMLNIGFDRNRKNNNKIFYNITGTWQNTQFEGSIMMRPSFGIISSSTTSTPKFKNVPFVIYPNPSTQAFSINISETYEFVRIAVYSITGQLVIECEFNNQPIDISTLSPGTYIVKAYDKNKVLGTQKLVIVR